MIISLNWSEQYIGVNGVLFSELLKEMKMEYVYFVFLVVLIITSTIGMLASGFSVIGVALGLALMTVPYANHNSDLASVEFQERIIKIETDYAKKLRSQLNSLPKVDNSLLNADTPYSAIVVEISNSERRVRDANETILNAEISIAKRGRFITAFALWFF